MTKKKKAGTPTIVEATRKDSSNSNRSASASRVEAAISRAALWGLLPIRLAEMLIRLMRSA